MTRSIILDLGPLRNNPVFRWFWLGTSLQMLGSQITAFAVLYQAWEMTGSTLMTGMVGLVVAVPTILFGFLGGILADTRDRRRLMLRANLGAVIATLLLVGQWMTGVTSPALLLVLAAAQSGCVALGQPARKATIQDVLSRDQLAAGIALTHAAFQTAMLGGPAIAGLVASIWGVAGCYIAVVAALVLAFAGLAALPQTRQASGSENLPDRLVAGLRAVLMRPVLRGALLADLAAMLLAMPIALFPALNERHFGGSPETLGLFLSAIAAGGITATLMSGMVTRASRLGAIQLVAAATWGLALAVTGGLAWSGWLALLCLVVAGAADTIAVMARGAIVQLSSTPELRGRIMAAEQIVGVAAPQAGNFRAGSMAMFMPPGAAVACGGIMCAIAVAAIAWTHPRLAGFRAGETQRQRR